MLIETEADENALPLDAVIILADGVAAQLDAYSGFVTDESQRGKRFWRTTGSTYIDSPLPDRLLPATLVHPRRYGAEDVERVAKAVADLWTDENEYGGHESIARAALNALEGEQ